MEILKNAPLKKPLFPPLFFRSWDPGSVNLVFSHHPLMNSHKSKFDTHPTFPHHCIEIVKKKKMMPLKPLKSKAMDQGLG